MTVFNRGQCLSQSEVSWFSCKIPLNLYKQSIEQNMDEVELPHIPELLKCNYTYSFDYGLYLTLVIHVHVASELASCYLRSITAMDNLPVINRC